MVLRLDAKYSKIAVIFRGYEGVFDTFFMYSLPFKILFFKGGHMMLITKRIVSQKEIYSI